MSETGSPEGLVIRAQSRRFEALVGEDQLHIVVPKKLRYHQPEYVDPVAVGDHVILDSSSNDHVVEEVLPRKNLLSRPASGRQGKRLLVAANLDLAVVVLAASEPVYKTTTIDRYLIMASAAGIPAMVCINKVDLDSEVAAGPEFQPYKDLEIPLVWVSAATGFGIETLIGQLSGKISVLIGPSGVGKSSLINRLVPEAQLPVGNISDRTQKGRHTTSWVEMRFLTGGGGIVDSPGLRVLDLTGVMSSDLGDHFPEIAEWTGSCKFHDCRHVSEPGCAIKEAVASGAMAERRYESYIRVYESLEAGEG